MSGVNLFSKNVVHYKVQYQHLTFSMIDQDGKMWPVRFREWYETPSDEEKRVWFERSRMDVERRSWNVENICVIDLSTTWKPWGRSGHLVNDLQCTKALGDL